MSYDLFFTAPRISKDQFVEYFSGRANYEVSDGQCIYQNEDTGVYFIFDHNEEETSDPEESDASVSFNLNYFRPHVFGLEAVDEVTALVEHFGFSIHDPQMDGAGTGPYTREAFLSGWNRGNEFGYSALLRGDGRPEKLWTLPGPKIEQIWRWNLTKTKTQDNLGRTEDIFVPRIFHLAIGGRTVSVVVWPDAIRELIPEVDFVIIGRDELAPRGMLDAKKDSIIVPFERFKSLLEPFETTAYAMRSFKLPAPQVPANIQNAVRELKPTGITGEGIPADKVLNKEIVARVSQ